MINLKSATALGLNISPALLALGDDAIEQDFRCRCFGKPRGGRPPLERISGRAYGVPSRLDTTG
jgi:hypothetical protein